MKIFDQYLNQESKNLIENIFYCRIFLSVIFVDNQMFSNDKNYNLKLRFYDLQGGSRIISTRPFGEPNNRVTARNINGQF
jgi:hypothetical protein